MNRARRSGRGDAALHWDPFDPVIGADPHPVWRRLRDEAPLYRNDEFDFWALSRFDDVQAAHRDPATFISGRGTVLELMGPDLSRMSSILFLDPPEHEHLRHLVSRAFTGNRVAALEEQVRAICREYLDPQAGSGGFDYVADFAAQLPSRVISALLGVPEIDRPGILETIGRLFHIEPGVGMVNDVSMGAAIAMHEYLAALLEERRRQPRDDMLSALVEAEIEDGDSTRRLSVSEATDFANLLVSAGTETVGRLLSWAAVVLAEHPAQRAQLATDRMLVPHAVEELLRFEPPSPVQGRYTTRPFERHGTVVPAGSKVLLLTGAAGRDERTYDQPELFDIHRRFDSHVSFGFGIHFCLGAALARLEARVAIEETLARFPEWEVDRDRCVFVHTSTVRGYQHVPISF